MPLITAKHYYGLPCLAKYHNRMVIKPMESRRQPMTKATCSLVETGAMGRDTAHRNPDLPVPEDIDIGQDLGTVKEEITRQRDSVHGAIRVGGDHLLDRGPEAGEQMNQYAKLKAILGVS
jgi:hypothetical protein